jgi:hypothetical protein
MGQQMPYISKAARERERARQQEQRERARWMHLKDAVKYVQEYSVKEEKEACTEESATEQLFTAIVDQALPARWDAERGLQRVVPSEFGKTVKVCLDGVGFAKRDRVKVKLTSPQCPKLEFVKGPVVDFDSNPDAPFTDINTADYVPLLVLQEFMRRWPLVDSGIKTRNNKSQTRRPPPASDKQILEAARDIYRTSSPNQVIAEQLIRKRLPGARRLSIIPILKRDEFDKLRPSPGKQPKE